MFIKGVTQMSSRRKFLGQATVAGLTAMPSMRVARAKKANAQAIVSGGPDPIFEKPPAKTVADLSNISTSGVSAIEVNDFAPGHYQGALTPGAPHADLNPKKAVAVIWK